MTLFIEISGAALEFMEFVDKIYEDVAISYRLFQSPDIPTNQKKITHV